MGSLALFGYLPANVKEVKKVEKVLPKEVRHSSPMRLRPATPTRRASRVASSSSRRSTASNGGSIDYASSRNGSLNGSGSTNGSRSVDVTELKDLRAPSGDSNVAIDDQNGAIRRSPRLRRRPST